eukprot:scaffold11699_cov109-Isochrysis_galbana.AAC.5
MSNSQPLYRHNPSPPPSPISIFVSATLPQHTTPLLHCTTLVVGPSTPIVISHHSHTAHSVTLNIISFCAGRGEFDLSPAVAPLRFGRSATPPGFLELYKRLPRKEPPPTQDAGAPIARLTAPPGLNVRGQERCATMSVRVRCSASVQLLQPGGGLSLEELLGQHELLGELGAGGVHHAAGEVVDRQALHDLVAARRAHHRHRVVDARRSAIVRA